eukprot:1700639-Rhodomonas_salina.2
MVTISGWLSLIAFSTNASDSSSSSSVVPTASCTSCAGMESRGAWQHERCQRMTQHNKCGGQWEGPVAYLVPASCPCPSDWQDH